MVTFIGDNDKSTLDGVIEELNREIKIEQRKAGTAKLQRDKYAAAYAVAKMVFLRDWFAEAAKNGPTPDLTKLATAKLRLTNESVEALTALRDQGYRPQAGTRSADDIANDLLSTVKLDNEELLVPDVTRCKNCDHPIKDEDGYRHHPSGNGYVHKYCPEEGDGFEDVDAGVSCTFCGYDLDDQGVCINGISSECAPGEDALSDLEATVQELASQAGIVVAVTPVADETSWFVLFDGTQVVRGARTRVRALTSALERLSMRLQGKLYGKPDITFGPCVDGCVADGDTGPKVVYFNGDGWQCKEHRDGTAE